MPQVVSSRVGLWALPLAFAALVAAGQVTGQEGGPTKAEKRVTRRLPPYYGEVVTQDQREKIYALQAKFSEQVSKLREQIEALEMQQKTEVDALLTPEQRQQVARLMEEAKAKRSKKATKDQAATANK